MHSLFFIKNTKLLQYSLKWKNVFFFKRVHENFQSWTFKIVCPNFIYKKTFFKNKKKIMLTKYYSKKCEFTANWCKTTF